MKKPRLSILICSVNNRVDNFLQNIIRQIDSQMADEVEVITLVDNKSMSIWEKRNNLISMAKWDYVVFVDDDDKISTDYIHELLKWIESWKDVICFDAMISINWDKYKLVDYDINNAHTFRDDIYYRLPNHLMCWKSELAKQVKYEDISFWEDTKRANDMIWLVHCQHKIHKVLYYYDYNDSTSESIKHKA
jgi:hypothetical protein